MHVLLKVLLCLCAVVLGHCVSEGGRVDGGFSSMVTLCTGLNYMSGSMSNTHGYGARSPGRLSNHPNNSAHQGELDMDTVAYRLELSTGLEKHAFRNHCILDLEKSLQIEAYVCPARWTSESKISSYGRVDLTTNLNAPTTKPTPDVDTSVPESIEGASLECMKSSGPTWLYAGGTWASDVLAISMTMFISALTVSFMFVELSGI